MLGLMQDRPLTLTHVFHRAEQYFGHKRIVTAEANGETTTTIAEWAARVRRLATVLDTLEVSADGRTAIASVQFTQRAKDIPQESVPRQPTGSFQDQPHQDSEPSPSPIPLMAPTLSALQV